MASLLAQIASAWHGRTSTVRERHVQRVGSGILVTIGLLVGSIIGVSQGQPSLGLVGGLVVGLVAAGVLTLWDVRRRR